MRDGVWYGSAALVAAAAVLTVGVLVMFASPGGTPVRSTPARSLPGPVTYLHLTVGNDPRSGTDSFSPPTIAVQAHTRLLVTITNYDTSVGPLFVPWDTHVIGTLGGTEQVTYNNSAATVSAIPSSDISHTFTVRDGFYNLSVPIPPARSAQVPAVVTFELSFGIAETTIWACVGACHSGVMGADRMFGPLVIEA